DTSYSGEEEELVGEGFKPVAVERDGWIWGLGSNNMKSGLAAALVVLEALVKAKVRLRGDVIYAGVVGEIEKAPIEEFQGIAFSGYGSGSKHLVTHGVTADFALLSEPTGMRICTANMGCIWFRVTVRGTVNHSAFSNRPGIVNAIELMNDLQRDLKNWAKEYESQNEYAGEHPNVTMGAIRGGAPWRLSRNPHNCSLYFEARTVPGQTTESIKRQVRSVLTAFAKRTDTPEPEMFVYVTDPPLEIDASLPVVEALSRAQKEVCGEALWHSIRRPGADAIHFSSYGVPCVQFGPGMARTHPEAKGRLIHEMGEHVYTEDVHAAAKIYLATVMDVCNRPVADRH
ncbi:MAG: M20/M25/M40 family metallo-hydrolase, partial [Gammaproteobacteria bacterium]|nr:M20/M25/M40 family metallo-hydrolase [Gammaproteobacteria bacterium]